MIDRQQIEQTIAVLQAQRATLGDDVVETSLAVLSQQAAALAQQEAATSALRGERKQVTVMFADISGFTAMSEKLDPEEVRSMINACFERLGAVIDRYDGHIDKFIGDEIMALFGAPVAHENDPERTLRAALDMVAALEAFNAEHAERIPKPLALHFGINTGLVIAGGIGTRQRQDYSVMGDPVNLAARLEGLSETGEILVGEDTYRLTALLFEFQALKPIKVKGKAKPVQVYRLQGVKKGIPTQIRGVEGLSSPLVGRQKEMALLKETLANFQKGQGGVVSIIGEAGLGKSRLITELGLMCSQKPQEEQPDWAEGRALSYGQSASYLVARDLLHHLLGVNSEAAPAEVDQALRSEIELLFPIQTADIYPYLGHLLEVPLDEESKQRIKYLEGEALTRRILQSAQDYISVRARQHPLALVWEDLHWADPSSLGLLKALLPLTEQCPLLLLLVYRPRRERRIWTFHQEAREMMGEAHLAIELAPLTLAESRELLTNLLGVCDLPEKTSQLILSKAEGNPFFVEEVIRSLIESGVITPSDDGQRWLVTGDVDDIQIPDTLQGVVMARIDRLDPESKRILQVASVIGRTFQYKVLAYILNGSKVAE